MMKKAIKEIIRFKPIVDKLTAEGLPTGFIINVLINHLKFITKDE